MLKYPCLVLDHDDTVVDSEVSVNYPCFCESLQHFRPGKHMELNDYTRWCFQPGFVHMCKELFDFTDDEIEEEFQMWLRYAQKHPPKIFPGIEKVVQRQKSLGGIVCVVSHSGSVSITRDYQAQIGIVPDAIYGWDHPDPRKKPDPWPLTDIMERHHLSPSELLVVDDLKPGYDMAHQLGVPFAFAGWGRKNVPEIPAFMRQFCDFAFDAVEEFYNFLFN